MFYYFCGFNEPFFVYMAVSRQKKESILNDLAEEIKKSSFVVFVNFHGLNTAAARKLRLTMKNAGAKYQVAKKTLIKKALEKHKFSGNLPGLEGEIGVIFGSGEIIAAAKNLIQFIKEHKELAVSSAIMEKEIVGPKIISEIASIPSREILLSKLVYALNSPLSRLVGGLKGNLQKFVLIISQKSAKGSSRFGEAGGK